MNTVPDAWPQLVELVNPDEDFYVMGLDTFHSSPGSFIFTECRGATTTCSNPWTIAFTGDQNYLVISPKNGELYNLDRTAGNIWKFKPDATPDGQVLEPPPGNNGTTASFPWEVSIAFDALNNLVWETDHIGAYGWDAVTSAVDSVTGSWFGDDLSDSYVEGGVYCGTAASVGNLDCFAANILNPTVAHAPAGLEPWSLTMITLNPGTQTQETDAISYDREGTALYFFTVAPPTSGGTAIPTITLKNLPGPPAPPNPLILTGLTPADTLARTGQGGWYLARFETGPLAGTVVLFSAYDNTLIFVNANTMTETGSVILHLPSGYGTPFRIAADETNGRVIVALANAGAATSTSFVAVTPTGTVTPLTAVAQNVIAVGLGVSADGSKIYACMRDQCLALDNK